jgi:hypothetical protein
MPAYAHCMFVHDYNPKHGSKLLVRWAMALLVESTSPQQLPCEQL